jgi:hypothetical protein
MYGLAVFASASQYPQFLIQSVGFVGLFPYANTLGVALVPNVSVKSDAETWSVTAATK